MSDQGEFDGLSPEYETLKAVKPNLEPTPLLLPPPPKQTASMSTALQRRRYKKPRPQGRMADSVVLTFMGNSNYPDVAARAAVVPLEGQSDSDSEMVDKEQEMEDMDAKISAQLLRDQEAARKGPITAAKFEPRGPSVTSAPAPFSMSRPPVVNGNGNPIVPASIKTDSPIKLSPPLNRSPPAEGLKGLCIDGVSRLPTVLEPATTTTTATMEAFPAYTEDHFTSSPLRPIVQTASPEQKLAAFQQGYTPSPRIGPGSPATQLPSVGSLIKEVDRQSREQHHRLRAASTSSVYPSPAYSAGLSVQTPQTLLPTFAQASPTVSHAAMSPPSASGLPSSFDHFRRPSHASEVTSPPFYAPHSASTTYSISTNDSHTSGSDAFSPPQSATYPTPADNNGRVGATPRATIDFMNRAPVNGATPLTIVSPTMQQLPQQTSPKSAGAPQLAAMQTLPPHGAEGFKCTQPNCNAAPFQTQYLLNSHKTVHSNNRPHYCSVAGCPRSVPGKGFKRKNEMIRHGLVHESPGYICPFCPDREHRYPRPDNLQRHVRAHHGEDKKDDPQLREVLAQRGIGIGATGAGGGGRGRRRRNTVGA